MKRAILTSSSGADLAKSGLAEIAILFFFRFTWGPLPGSEHFATYFAARSGKLRPGDHWSDWCIWPPAIRDRKNQSLADFCEPYDTIELWFEPTPEDQLQLIWLLDYLGSYPALVRKLRLRLVIFKFVTSNPEALARSESYVRVVDVEADELDTARRAWRAYCAPTPEACFNLIHEDLSALPVLKPAFLDLLAELPSHSTGAGATEMGILALIARGFTRTGALDLHLRRAGLFGEIEIGWLLQGLAHGPRPSVAGLDDELRTLRPDDHKGRHEAFLRSRLSLTEFGKEVLAGKEDFSRHNPIDRWWGGTRLTNDRLWRYGPVLTKP
jgi:hypothetical protein